MPDTPIISADSHVAEPPDLWEKHIEPRFRDRAPRVVRDGDRETWYVDGHNRLLSVVAGASAGSKQRPGEIDPDFVEPPSEGLFDKDVRPGAYDPVARVADMKVDGIHGEVIFPTLGLIAYRWIEDNELRAASFRAYNDWLAAFCNVSPGMFKGCALIDLQDLDGAVGEIQRAARAGLAGAMISVAPSENRQYDDSVLDPFWAVAHDLNMPLILHVGTNRVGNPKMGAAYVQFLVNADYWVRHSVTAMIFSGVFDRFPGLKVVSVEHELGWVPHFIQTLDSQYVLCSHLLDYRLKNDALPSDVARSNFYVTFQEDALGIETRDILGADNIMWSSDYPHRESSWPESQKVLRKILAGVPEAERRKMTYENAVKVYGFTV